MIGTPVANRTRRRSKGLIGFFVNTLALRIDLSGDTEQLAVAARVKRRRWRRRTTGPAVRAGGGDRPARAQPGHTPLFQVMFAWQNTDAGTLELPGLTLTSAEIDIPWPSSTWSWILGASGRSPASCATRRRCSTGQRSSGTLDISRSHSARWLHSLQPPKDWIQTSRSCAVFAAIDRIACWRSGALTGAGGWNGPQAKHADSRACTSCSRPRRQPAEAIAVVYGERS